MMKRFCDCGCGKETEVSIFYPKGARFTGWQCRDRYFRRLQLEGMRRQREEMGATR